MFRSAFPPFSSVCSSARGARTARYFHRVTTDFVTHDTRGNLLTKRVPIIIGDPGEAYVLLEKEVGSALSAADPSASAFIASAENRCKLTFFHASQHFGFELSSYPRLYVPNQLPRQTELDTSPATLLLDGKMDELVLDGTFDATFAEHASATARTLGPVLDQLKDM
ncbi:uncharacterized protein N7500_000254 [Penicillium coprophilum]|uniref:uncharacterized protein n=1 Tax=Penicillium coprophilum TaxID=36646 RepID=UPI002396E492|nr:uncharacterized protein N7500_000254 [Penicillium coprophilum]KAJ5177555.1 hypothetical protein N7500_000254 [Penicillium coprophilum]